MSINELIKYAQTTIPSIVQMGGDAGPFIKEMIKVAATGRVTKADFDRIKAMEKPLRDELQKEEPE